MPGPPLVNGGGGSSRSAKGDATSSSLPQGAALSASGLLPLPLPLPPPRSVESAADPSAGAAAAAVATTTATARPPIASAAERPPPAPPLPPCSTHPPAKSSSSRLTRAQSLPEPPSSSASAASPHPPQHLRVASTNDPHPPPPAPQQLQHVTGDDGPRPPGSSGSADPTSPPRGGDVVATTTTESEGTLQGETSGGGSIGGDAAAVESGGEHHVLQRKGRFTLLQPALSPPSIGAAAGAAAAAPAAIPTSDAAAGAAGDADAAAMAEGVATQAPQPSPSDALLPPSLPPAAAAPTVQSEPPAARGTKKKGRFTLMHETAPAPAVTIVVDRAPSHGPSSHPPDPERGVSMASTAMSSLSASVMPAGEPGPLLAAHPAMATIPAPSSAAASTSSAPTVKKMGRFVVSSVDPHAGDAGTAPGPPHSVTIPVGIHHHASAVSEPVVAEGPAHAGAVGGPSDSPAIPREVVAVLEHGTGAGGTASAAAQGRLAGLSAAPQPHHGPSPPPHHPPTLPPQPILYALVPAPIQLPSQPVPHGSMGAAEPVPHVSGACTAPPTTTTMNAEIGSTPPTIRPSLSSSNLAAADVAPTGQQKSHVPHGSTSMSQPGAVAPLHVPAPLPAARDSSSVPVQPLAHDALHVPPSSRSVEASSAATTAPQPPASTPGGKGGEAKARHTASGYTGRQGVGKMFHYLDQLRLEATDAEHTIKNLMTDVRLLKEKNKELEATARDTERKLIEERKLREAAEHKLKQAKKKLRDLAQATSQPREDHTKSASTSYDSLGIAASLSGEYRDDRMTIEPPIESVAASAAPLSPPFSRRPEQACTPTRDYNPALGYAGCPSHSSPSASAAAFVAKGNLNLQPPVEPGRQSAGNSPRTSQQARLLLSNSGKLPPLPNTGAPQVATTNGGSARTPNDRPPLGSSNPARDIQHQSQNGTAPPSRSLAMEFDPMRPANRDRLPSGDSISDLPEITSEPVAHAALPNPVHPVSPTQRLASKTYHGIRDLHQQFHLQQPALDSASAVPTLHPSSSFSEFRHMVLVPQNPDAAHGGSPIVFAFPSSFAPNGNQQWIPVAVQDPTTFVAQQLAPGSVPELDPFDEIVRRTSNPG